MNDDLLFTSIRYSFDSRAFPEFYKLVRQYLEDYTGDQDSHDIWWDCLDYIDTEYERKQERVINARV